MELLQGIETRMSTRAFKSTPIPRATIEKILRAASKSPSYANTQPWEAVVVSGKKRDELSKVICDLSKAGATPHTDIPTPTTWPEDADRRSKEHYANRSKVIGIARDDEAGRKALRLLNFEFYGAPCSLFLFMDATLSAWSIFDLGLYAQTVCLAAHSFGLGTCLQASTVRYPDAIRDFLGISKTKQLIVGISIGYPDAGAKINQYHSERAGVDTFTQWYT